MIEVLVALTILIVGVVASMRLIGAASITNQLSKERVIATNLAREGIEAVRSIRDTNWLRSAGERRRCWNNASSTSQDCNAVDLMAHEQSYRIDYNQANYQFELAATAQPLDIKTGTSTDNLPYRMYRDVNTDIYTHDDASGANDGTLYFRQIYFEYLNDAGTAMTPETTEENANVLRVTSTVQWADRGVVNDVALTTILTDYLGRKDHQ